MRIAIPMNEQEVSGSSSRIKQVWLMRNAMSELVVGERGNAVASSALVVAANKWLTTTSLPRPSKFALIAFALMETAPAYRIARSSGTKVGLSSRSSSGCVCVFSGNHAQKLRHSLENVGTWISGIIGCTPSRKLRYKTSQCFLDGIECRIESISFPLVLSMFLYEWKTLSASGEGEHVDCGGVDTGAALEATSGLLVFLRTWFRSTIYR